MGERRAKSESFGNNRVNTIFLEKMFDRLSEEDKAEFARDYVDIVLRNTDSIMEGVDDFLNSGIYERVKNEMNDLTMRVANQLLTIKVTVMFGDKVLEEKTMTEMFDRF